MIDPMLVDLGNQMLQFEWTIPGWPFAMLAFLLLPFIRIGLTTLARPFDASTLSGERATRGTAHLRPIPSGRLT